MIDFRWKFALCQTLTVNLSFQHQLHDVNEMQAMVSSPSGKLVDSPLNGQFEIKLSGEKSGYKFKIDINTLWDKKGSYDHLDARQKFFLVR